MFSSCLSRLWHSITEILLMGHKNALGKVVAVVYLLRPNKKMSDSQTMPLSERCHANLNKFFQWDFFFQPTKIHDSRAFSFI